MSAVVPAGDLSALDQMDPAVRELAVTEYLEHARDQLTLAVNLSGPAAVAALKAEIATAAEATKQLGLSKEIQTDAQEMVRRAEFALGKAIRAGQERGEIRKRFEDGGPRSDYMRNGKIVAVHGDREPTSISPGEFFTNVQQQVETYALADGVSSAEFDAALTDARAEGNLSRANVVRKVKGVKTEGLTALEKLVKIREMAPSGRTSAQIAAEIGTTEKYVRLVARTNDIEITADRVMNRSRRGIDSNRIVQETVTTLEGLTIGLGLVVLDDLDPTQAENWAVSLTESIRALNRLTKQIKEMTQ